MRFELPPGALEVLRRLNAAGYQAYAVGGCVRDLARGVPPHDYDICTSALPAQTERCFAGERVVETGIKHGTVTVLMAGEPYEITTFRTDGDYLDGRHPQSVAFTDSLTEDLRRRDFTINAMAYHPDIGLRDPFDGQADIARRMIRCVGDAGARFTEDALRILRALRFAAELGFDIAPDTARAMRELSGRLALISRERIAAELLRALKGINAVPVLQAFDTVLLAALPLILNLYTLSPASRELATQLVFIHDGFAMLLWPLALSMPNALRAANDVKFTMVLSIGSMVCFRIALSYVVGVKMGYGALGVWFAMLVDWLFRAAVYTWRFEKGKWENMARI